MQDLHQCVYAWVYAWLHSLAHARTHVDFKYRIRLIGEHARINKHPCCSEIMPVNMPDVKLTSDQN